MGSTFKKIVNYQIFVPTMGSYFKKIVNYQNFGFSVESGKLILILWNRG